MGPKDINAKNGSNTRRYFAALDNGKEWPPVLAEYYGKFSRTQKTEETGELPDGLNDMDAVEGSVTRHQGTRDRLLNPPTSSRARFIDNDSQS